MLAAVYGLGGTMKSAELTALPLGVETEMRPDPAADGTLVAILVVEEEDGDVRMVLNATLSFDWFASKSVPVMVTAVPAGPTAGENPVMVGIPVAPAITLNEAALVVKPVGDVTVIAPVVAPAGTVVTIKLVLDEVTVAKTPLNATVFWLAVALKPVPYTVTDAPAGPLSGLNRMIDT